MKFRLIESIDQQPDVEYKGRTIQHFPYSMKLGDKEYDIDGWVILSHYYIKGQNDEKLYMPLYCEDEYGDTMNFKTLESAKEYIDKYIADDKGTVEIKHGDEVHFIPNVEEEINEDTVKVKDHKWVNKGEDGTHGEFKTKKEADAQRKAMFANGYKG